MDTSGWTAVRCVFLLRPDPPPVYEERITLWRCTDLDEAIARAEAEAAEYAELLEAEYVGLAQAYLLYDDPADGAEIFSLCRTSDLDPEDYLDRFFDAGTEHQRIIES